MIPGIVASSSAVAGPTLVVSDNFTSYANGATVTNSTYFNGPAFPNEGTWTGNPSSIWEMDTGWLYEAGDYGYSGRPIDWTDKYFHRLRTIDTSVENQWVKWRYKSAGNAVDGYSGTAEAGDAVDLWLRYQTQYHLYALQIDRADNEVASIPTRIYLKRKVPADASFGGTSSWVRNNGVYFYIPLQGSTTSWYQTWTGLGLSELAHDSTTTYDFQVKCETTGASEVTIKLYLAGNLLVTWVDDNGAGVVAPNGTTTMATCLSNGWFSSTSGYSASNYTPITQPGAVGFRSDNRKYWFTNFELYDLG